MIEKENDEEEDFEFLKHIAEEETPAVIKRIRLYLKMSPTEFADFLKIKSVKTIYNWESPNSSSTPPASALLFLFLYIGLEATHLNILKPLTRKKREPKND
ncbi:helix-turn-helix domain-containing protein [Marinibactrum halimedae]|uniref:Uncharacterized protein n=1 Tax=Marinibactrum halimedae TaxID=1444977 RepID=A0AA37T4B4_9GAMM|nr:hypothetical protein [Marinibactrum halimedae]MCD9457441.1 hypothetical protein [Marinibactrum halimedae]GLS25509.1 hypothetical protein GCM10007877_12230 [Marinibactrum halimedae]